jgi:hypothetical protein
LACESVVVLPCERLVDLLLILSYTQDWPAHHALADARALMEGYRAWRGFMEKIWRIE